MGQWAVLIIAATPIGNLGDASRRLIEALARDGDRGRGHAHDHPPACGPRHREPSPADPLHEHNEDAKAAEIVELARATDVLVLSDAACPRSAIPAFPSSPRPLRRCHGHRASGPSAVLTALAVSGLPTDRFSFEGFLPRKGRVAYFESLSREPRTMVFFESPNRLPAALADLVAALGPDRRVVVCRELTKLHEEVKRGTAAELPPTSPTVPAARSASSWPVPRPPPWTLRRGVVQVLRWSPRGVRLRGIRGGRGVDRTQPPRALRGCARRSLASHPHRMPSKCG
ncbi:MAG: SAM-dependent methyltransferase [Galbitalea sp.]